MSKLTTSILGYEVHELPSDFYGARFSVWRVLAVHGLTSGRKGTTRVQVGTNQRTRAAAERLRSQAEKN
jgi:hypothetical protein